MTIHWKAVEQCFTVVLFVFQFVIFENLSVLGLSEGLKIITRPSRISDVDTCQSIECNK